MPVLIQIVIADSEYDKIERAARSRQLSVSEWARQALELALRDEAADVEIKLAVVREAVKYECPTADIETMLAEIEQGYLSNGYEP